MLKSLKTRTCRIFNTFLGWRQQNEKLVSVSQSKYVLGLLKETGKLGYKATKTPMDGVSKPESVEERALVDKGGYQKLTEKLIWFPFY